MKIWVRKLITPTGGIWILSHTIMILLGTLFLSAKSVHTVLTTGVSEGIGGSLVATGVAGISLFLYIASSDAMRARVEMLTKAGLSAIYSGRSVLIRDVPAKTSQRPKDRSCRIRTVVISARLPR